MTEMPQPMPYVPCLCHDAGPTDDGPGCMCGDSERVLRHVMRGKASLTGDQREWALQEIDRVEGYTRKDFEAASDAELGRGVIESWMDYCRDKGLL